MAVTLQNYLFTTRFYLRDSQSVFFTDQQVIAQINQARNNVIRDTACCRALALISTVGGQELYPFSTVLTALQQQGVPAAQIAYILNVTVDWTTTMRYSLDYMAWDDFNARYRVYPYQYVPYIYGMYDTQSFYVAPIPNTTYTMEVDSVYFPNPLVSGTDVDTALVLPWSDLVPIAAAYWCKYYENAMQEAMTLFQQYRMNLDLQLAGNQPYRVPSRYANDPNHP